MLRRAAIAACLLALLTTGAPVRAQESLAGMGTAMGAMGTMGAGQMGGAKQIGRAQELSGSPPKPVSAVVPAATQPSAATPQQPAAAPSVVPAPAAAAAPPPQQVDIHTPFQQSFFFTAQDILTIKQALEKQVVQQAQSNGPQQAIPPIRRINLAGVIYKNPDDWIIWLNCQKVTPRSPLKEIVDIKVEKESVLLHWFDIGANKVLVIPRLHPHQTYDIVTGVLLPMTECNPTPAPGL